MIEETETGLYAHLGLILGGAIGGILVVVIIVIIGVKINKKRKSHCQDDNQDPSATTPGESVQATAEPEYLTVDNSAISSTPTTYETVNKPSVCIPINMQLR